MIELEGADTLLKVVALLNSPVFGDEPHENFSLQYRTNRWDEKTRGFVAVDPYFSTVAWCSDFFWWGTSDSEPVTDENYPLLEEAAAEITPLYNSALGGEKIPGTHIGDYTNIVGLLFAAKSRGMRPQGAYYKHLPEDTWALFDACGPEREANVGNPRTKPEAA